MILEAEMNQAIEFSGKKEAGSIHHLPEIPFDITRYLETIRKMCGSGNNACLCPIPGVDGPREW
jgi:hypothetical protein